MTSSIKRALVESARDVRLGLRERGIFETARRASRVIHDRSMFRRAERWAEVALRSDDFDLRYGTDTAGMLHGADLGVLWNARGAAVHPYQTLSSAELREVVASFAEQCAGFDFIDLGCGKGKPLLIASEFRFENLVGIDISEKCVDIARQNARRFAQHGGGDARRFDIRTEDAERFELGKQPAVLFLNNPFPAEVVRIVMARAAQSLRDHPRRMLICYFFPFAADEITGALNLVRVPSVFANVAILATRPGAWAWPVPPAG